MTANIVLILVFDTGLGIRRTGFLAVAMALSSRAPQNARKRTGAEAFPRRFPEL
jgi:hypothetical protein